MSFLSKFNIFKIRRSRKNRSASADMSQEEFAEWMKLCKKMRSEFGRTFNTKVMVVYSQVVSAKFAMLSRIIEFHLRRGNEMILTLDGTSYELTFETVSFAEIVVKVDELSNLPLYHMVIHLDTGDRTKGLILKVTVENFEGLELVGPDTLHNLSLFLPNCDTYEALVDLCGKLKSNSTQTGKKKPDLPDNVVVFPQEN